MGHQPTKYTKCLACKFYGSSNKRGHTNNPYYCTCVTACINGDECKKSKKKTITQKSQTFDSLIMECQDTLSIETEIDKRYHKWLKDKNICKKPTAWGILYPLLNLISFSLMVSCMISWSDKATFSLPYVFGYALGAIMLITASYGFSKGMSNIDLLPLLFSKKGPKKASENMKFEFLRDAYIGTIKDLNTRLDAIKEKIRHQISEHQKDRLSIQEYCDIFTDIKEPLEKIDSAILSLEESHKKVSDRQSDINQVLEEYTGENGYISQKEKEIERIRIAQELSDRMRENFQTTLEITKSVDVLSDTIIPGIKKLMSFKLPELINEIDLKCDTNRAFLEISS